jgi:hypothetical protein
VIQRRERYAPKEGMGGGTFVHNPFDIFEQFFGGGTLDSKLM